MNLAPLKLLKPLKNLLSHNLKPRLGTIDFIKYIGPGFLVTIGFIDPGNWASDLAAGSYYGYTLLWVVTLSTVMLIVLQHNAAHLGIVTGKCLSEAATSQLRPWVSRPLLGTAVIATIATALAEVLGTAIALKLLFGLDIRIGAVLAALLAGWMLLTNSYMKIERWIIGFVSLIGLSFIFELCIVHIHWGEAARSWVVPGIPHGSVPIIMSVLGAVVMPHNLFLHSEIIQSRQYNLKDKKILERGLKFEFLDTLISMIVGWGINSAIILLAAAAFFTSGIHVTDISQTRQILQPLLGNFAAIIFAIALLFSGISSSITAGMAGGSIVAGMFAEPYDINDWHTKLGIAVTLVFAVVVTFFVADTFKVLIASQVLLSMQLPLTIFMQIYLTSSKKVMGDHRNSIRLQVLLGVIGGVVAVLNVMLLWTLVR